ncbi:phosphate ABC transporter permease subunit PstC [Teredinibacter purpureus]|uniref:phosphate ABC transporter permease subunit PstC n=1 Tax=Teredinibacter purpureus TaxID=2731756 RepID=UPI0005F78E16|nr:phosphate ABC transporter permease subunit PstC [Teredinibacter purpureus]
MDTWVLIILMGAVFMAVFYLGRGRSLSVASSVGGTRYLNSLPYYYGVLAALWAAVPAIVLLALWEMFDTRVIEGIVLSELPATIDFSDNAKRGLILNQIYNLAAGQKISSEIPAYMTVAVERIQSLTNLSRWIIASFTLSLMALTGGYCWWRINPQLRARSKVEKMFRIVLLGCASLAILTTVGIVMSVLIESLRFFHAVPISEFLFGLEWSPQTAIRKDQVAGSSSFGAVPLFAGTLLIAGIAMLLAVPTGLMSAIYLSEYAPRNVRSIVKPLLEILAGIPTVVYGFFAAITVAPFIRDVALAMGLDNFVTVTSESALAAGLVMGVMIIPFISSLSDDVINAVPQSLRDGAFGLGATRSEVIRQVVIPAALPGIVGGVLLAVSRAIGETMIVVMAAGLAAKLTANPLDSVTTVTVQIVTLLVGDQEFDSPKTLAAFALGLMLFVVTLILNYIALYVVRKYREQYE